MCASFSSVVAIAATIISGCWCFSAIMSVGLGTDALLWRYRGRGAGTSLLLSFVIVLSCSSHGATDVCVTLCHRSWHQECLVYYCNARDSSFINHCCACGLTGHPPRTQHTITVVMVAWCQCGVPWLNITFKFGPRGDVCATVPSVRDV